MENVASELFSGMSIFKSLHGLGKIGLTKARNRISTPLRVEKLSDDLFSSAISYGAVVTVKGVLTRYGQTYRPLSYVPTIPAKSDDKVVGVLRDPRTRQLVQKCETTARFRLFQFPVQTLPPFEDESGRYCLAFLYPEGFNSFLLPEDPKKKQVSKSDTLLIASSHQPIPVLLPEEMLENVAESNVTVTGVVSLLPEPVVDSISTYMCQTREELNYAFLRPHSTRIGFCLDCRDRLNSDFRQDSKLSSLPGALYVEGHFEGVVDDRYKAEFKASIPKGLPLNFCYSDHPGKDLFLTADEHVSVVGSEPSIYGFYAETDLVDQRRMHNSIKHLNEFYTEFRKSAANKVRRECSAEVRFKPDFVFDYRRQRYFHPDGVLRSTEVDDVLTKHRELAEVASWLRNAQ